MEPLLSICIPTYNRRVYLESTLADLAPILARAPVEIVVVDDASSDDTGAFLDGFAAREPRARVIRQPKRLGGFENTLYALRAGRGRYTVYNGDDDRLLADGIFATLDFLEAHPGHAAVYGPIEGFDLTSGQSHGLSLHSSESVDFDQHRAVELIDYVARGLTPEHAVYRTASLAGVMHDPQIYWSLALLGGALRHGTVRFAPTPFYRATYTHWEGERREQLFERLMADTLAWETFRFGLEMLLAGDRDARTQPARLAHARAAIDRSIGKRHGTALDFLSAQGRWIEYVHAFRMLAVRSMLPRRFPELELITAALNAVALTIAAYRAMHGFERVALVGLRDLAVVLSGTLGALAVSTAAAPDLASTTLGARVLVVVADAAMLEQAVVLGQPRHALRDFSTLYAAFDLIALQGHGQPS